MFLDVSVFFLIFAMLIDYNDGKAVKNMEQGLDPRENPEAPQLITPAPVGSLVEVTVGTIYFRRSH